jgi:hypothetical protein
VLNVTRPVNSGVVNDGYLNAHYINDGKAANQIDAGVPQCPYRLRCLIPSSSQVHLPPMAAAGTV